MRKAFAIVGALCILLALILVTKTLLFQAPDPLPRLAPGPEVDTLAVVERLSRAIRIETVSREEIPPDSAAFLELHALLTADFPLAHARLSVERVAGLSLLYRWSGVDTSAAPLLLLAHQDVVPAADSLWENAPFDGVVDDGFVWGRGAIDDKSSLVTILTAVEALLADGFQPQADVLLAFGHDEELGGADGAAALSAQIRDRAWSPGLVVDEGGIVTHGTLPGVDEPIAVIGVAEKGSASVQLRITSDGGHSSMPPPSTSIGALASAITQLESSPMPARIDGATAMMLDGAGPYMNWPLKLVFANRWLFEPVLKRILTASTRTNATIRTTTAVTMVEGGTKANVLPSAARAVVNFRILPGDTDSSVLAHVTDVLSGTGIEASLLPGSRNPTALSPADSRAFRLLEETIRNTFDYSDMVVVPYLVVGGTDARWYEGLADNVYRFQPVDIPEDEGLRLHAVNERLSISALVDMVAFYQRLITAYPADLEKRHSSS